jgi:hypothetical protein
MKFASRIETRAAGGTLVIAAKILADRELRPARAAEYRRFAELLRRPSHHRVVCNGIVALDAGVIFPAAVKPDGDHVERRVVVRTPRIRTNAHSKYARPDRLSRCARIA